MTRGVRYTPLAEVDVLEISLYIGSENAAAGRRFPMAAYETAISVSTFPESGTPVAFGDAELRECRWHVVAGFRRYLLVYRIVGDGIEVVRVMHGARDFDAMNV